MSRTNLERMPSTGSMDSNYIPDVLRRSLGNALSVSQNERKRYNSAYKNASTSRKKKHIARHLRRKTSRRAQRKRAAHIEPIRIEEAPVVPRKNQRASDEYSRRSAVENLIAASLRRTDRVNNVNAFLDQQKGIKKIPM